MQTRFSRVRLGPPHLLVALAFLGRAIPAMAQEQPASAPNAAPPSAKPDEPFGASPPGSHPSNGEPPTSSSESGSDAEDSDGLLGPFRLGLMVGTGLPSVLNFSGLLKITRYFGAGVDFGLIPTLRISTTARPHSLFTNTTSLAALPISRGFFLGTGVGYATVTGTTSDTFDTSPYASTLPANLNIPKSLTYSSQGSVKTMVLTPQIGYLYTTKVGFSIGVDIGAQVPIAPSQIQFSSQLPLPPGTPQPLVNDVRTQLIAPNDQQVKSTLQSIARTPIPTFNVRIGWMLSRQLGMARKPQAPGALTLVGLAGALGSGLRREVAPSLSN